MQEVERAHPEYPKGQVGNRVYAKSVVLIKIGSLSNDDDEADDDACQK